MALAGSSGRSASQRVTSCPRASSARCMAGPTLARSITAPFSGNLIVLVTCSGSRMTRWASRGSTLTNAFIKLSSLTSCGLAGRSVATGTQSAVAILHLERRPRARRSRPPVAVLVVILVREPRVVVLEGHVGIAGWTEVFELPPVQLAAGHELLDAPAVDGFTREQVPLGIERDRVEEDEVACHVARTAEPGENRVGPRPALHQRAGGTLIGERERVVDLPDDLVAAADL